MGRLSHRRLDKGKVKILTRNLHDWTDRFPTIVKAVGELDAVDAMIDGEAFVADEKGLSHFSSRQQALGQGGRRHDIMLAVFDLLKFNGEDLRDRPLMERKAALRDLVGEPPPEGIVFSDEIGGDANAVFGHACSWAWRALFRSCVTAHIDLAGVTNG